jgi:ferric-dicitrate binding protein FerR (iron transport regulator)
MNFDQESRLSDIIARRFGGEIGDGDQALLDRWLAESAGHRELYERIMSGESIREREKRLVTLDPESTIDHIRRKLRRRRLRRASAWGGSAAAAVLAGALFLFPTRDGGAEAAHAGYAPLISLNGGRKAVLVDEKSGTEWMDHLAAAKTGAAVDRGADTGEIMIKIEIPRGGDIYKLKLADGSTVWLNSETTIEYPEKFGDARRNVRLTSGEAFFEVAAQDGKPFRVETPGDVTVDVTGTSFNITAYDGEGTVATTLVSGSVAVSTPRGSAGLLPGHRAVVGRADGRISVSEVDTSHANLWTGGIFDFDAIELEEICARLSRWYDVDFVFEAGTGGERFSGRVRIDDPLSDFLDNIAKVTDVTFSERQGRIVVKPK